jgi:hypothetical protein
MEWSEIASFALVASLLVISPGPNGVLVARTVPTSGRSAGFANVAGFVTGFYLHGAFSIFGISIILLQSATAFAIVKMLGGRIFVLDRYQSSLCCFSRRECCSGCYASQETSNFGQSLSRRIADQRIEPQSVHVLSGCLSSIYLD